MKSIFNHILKNKYYLVLSMALVLLSVASPGFNLAVSAKNGNKPGSKHPASKVREVLTGQHLFIVELSPVKGSKPKNKRVNFKAENRDAFMIICYDGDKTIKELDWTMCPNGKCPIAGTYDWGTKAYNQLDPVISAAKESNLKLQNRIKKFKRKDNKALPPPQARVHRCEPRVKYTP
jgi:hypothetical protein